MPILGQRGRARGISLVLPGGRPDPASGLRPLVSHAIRQDRPVVPGRVLFLPRGREDPPQIRPIVLRPSARAETELRGRVQQPVFLARGLADPPQIRPIVVRPMARMETELRSRVQQPSLLPRGLADPPQRPPVVLRPQWRQDYAPAPIIQPQILWWLKKADTPGRRGPAVLRPVGRADRERTDGGRTAIWYARSPLPSPGVITTPGSYVVVIASGGDHNAFLTSAGAYLNAVDTTGASDIPAMTPGSYEGTLSARGSL